VIFATAVWLCVHEYVLAALTAVNWSTPGVPVVIVNAMGPAGTDNKAIWFTVSVTPCGLWADAICVNRRPRTNTARTTNDFFISTSPISFLFLKLDYLLFGT
jgi:hypothetical protein